MLPRSGAMNDCAQAIDPRIFQLANNELCASLKVNADRASHSGAVTASQTRSNRQQSTVKRVIHGVAIMLVLFASLWLGVSRVFAQEDLAKQLSNPISSLVSLPYQFNFDRQIGPVRDGDKFTLNIQPVIPFNLNSDWNLISRTIIPLSSQSDIFPGAGSQSGFGSTLQSFFFSPVKPAGGWLIWGIGPAISVPSTNDPLLGSTRWGAGPTGVFLTLSVS
jgi:hypothetical protein